MLTVDFARLGLLPGERLLDLGCGRGRHAFEALRRGARVTALDADDAEVKDVAAVLGAMATEGQAARGGSAGAVCGDGIHLPFPDRAFDRVIASEVLEHLNSDRTAVAELCRVLRPGGTLAVTVPRWLPERVNWALSHDYHARPGGHMRVYRRSQLVRRLEEAGLRYGGRHHAHALHSPYWWLKCAVGVDRDDHRLVRGYHRLLVWSITHPDSPLSTLERLLDPVLGKSLVVYAVKPG